MSPRLSLAIALLLVTLPVSGQSRFFRVQVQNTGSAYSYLSSGAFDTPVGATSPAPIFPGEAYAFEFEAAAGSNLSFATMFVQSNDLFYAPGANGLPLWDSAGPRTADITSELMLWDAGTEANQEPGTGADQAPRQSGANTGAADSDSAVRLVNDGFSYPATADVIAAMLEHLGETRFRVTLTNASTGSTLATSTGTVAVPLSPGAYAVHAPSDSPMFVSGQADAGMGLEALAEDGDPAGLALALAAETGVTSIFAPGVWVVHRDGTPLFVDGQPDSGAGLEAIAEDGSPGQLVASLAMNGAISAGAFAVPAGAAGAGALLPGAQYEFVVLASPGDRLSLATMFVQSNDLFAATPSDGNALFDQSGAPVSGSLGASVSLWNAGTEVDQTPGAGADQAPRQAGADTGASDPNNVVRSADDSGIDVGQVLNVMVEPLESVALTVTLRNVSTGTTITTSGGTESAVPLAPGAWAVHTSDMLLFAANQDDFGRGLEAVAEDGNPTALAAAIELQAGVVGGAFNTPVGATGPAPIFPGDAYAFTIDAAPGALLSLATMFIPSNDAFFAPGENGIALWNDAGQLRLGDLTAEFMLWDAGTEANEEPAAGPNQAPNQAAANTGDADTDTRVRLISDGFTYPAVEDVIEVTLSLATSTDVDPRPAEVPQGVSLDQNYPNPFNPQTTIRFELGEAGPVNLAVFDLLGREVASLANESLSAGAHSFSWDGRDFSGLGVATGVYVYRLRAGGQTVSRQMVLLQ